ncbi:PIN domain-containing protein [Thermoactinospora rubra]|uniref:PIN domain-containing protein n=1 Tax=Thermoactinospora rubra TaxID=1088767 RepID=UPI000A121730|nr:PIN domain-containing protein [Thermoactinospora rubra]
MSAVIVDTSAILALFDEDYAEHATLAGLIATAAGPFVVSPFVLAEADYMLHSRLGPAAARRFAADVVAEAYELPEWTPFDHAAALAVSDQFSTDKDYLGLADASNVILADRYRTTSIATLDQRHFRTLRPLWGASHFTVLPYDG